MKWHMKREKDRAIYVIGLSIHFCEEADKKSAESLAISSSDRHSASLQAMLVRKNMQYNICIHIIDRK